MIRTYRILLFSIIMTAISPTSEARANGIDGVRVRIAHYEFLANQYLAAARSLNARRENTSQYQTLDVKEHSCGVLAELLGIRAGVAEGFTYPDPGLQSNDPHELMLFAISLGHYIEQAQIILSESEFLWRYKWNLNCADAYSSSGWVRMQDWPPYSIQISEIRDTLTLVGNIEPDLYNVIAKRLTIHRSIKKIELASLGGDGGAAFKIGRLLRKRGITTMVAGNCNSACALVFLGGVERIVPKPYWKLAFHRASSDGIPIWDGDEFYQRLRDYSNLMIGSEDDILRISLAPVGLAFYRPGREELCSLRIATRVDGVCDAGPRRHLIPSTRLASP
jgi:hypothetical protein